MSRIPESINRFIASLEKLNLEEDRAALAALRRGLGKEPGTASEMYPIVVPRLPPSLSPQQESDYYLIAALFGSHPEPGGDGSLGAAFARLRSERDSESIDKRFVALLNCHADDLVAHLQQAVSLLKSGNVSVDWRQLLYDMQYWDHPARFEQRQWARDFWTGQEPQTVEPTPDAVVSAEDERS
jgi:CRISPR system Cascade subunit CasB